MPSDSRDPYRALPAVHRLADAVMALDPQESWPRTLVIAAARVVIEEQRQKLSDGDGRGGPAVEALAQSVAQRLRADAEPLLPTVINATGIIIHTGLGRAPWAPAAARAAADAARGYTAVEVDMSDGRRGQRGRVVSPLLCDLTGAEAATVVNNNAAALVLVLSALARDRHVIVSRGELIEIGGSFRLPEIMETGGALLREVGTTNRTRLRDYERAIDDAAAALLKVHASNYRIEGFVESVSIEELAAMGRRRGIPVIHDIGSGLLRPLPRVPCLAEEPDAASSIAAGADIVLFSGDKLLGGPQSGIIVGRRDLVERIEKAPLMRAVRVDKVTLAALGATLQLHRDPQTAMREVPVLAMLAAPVAALEERAHAVARLLEDLAGAIDVHVTAAPAFTGGGSVPTRDVPSVALRLRAAALPEEELARRLRGGTPGVLARVGEGAVWLDLRTVLEGADEILARSVRAALE